jgi:hypothetical protein
MKNSLLTLLALCCIHFSFGQTTETDTTKSEQLYAITKNDGSEYIGKILSDDGREVLIETAALGKIYIPKSDIKSIVPIEDQSKIVHGEYSPTGPFTTRYAFTTNALPIKKGENYALINLYGPEVHFAVTDHLNVGVMTTWIASPMVLALKYSMKTKNENINLSLGTLMGSSGYLFNFRGFGGLHFANVTFGGREKNITLAGGYLYGKTGDNSYSTNATTGIFYSDQEYFSTGYNFDKTAPLTHGPIFSVAGITKVGARASFIFDSMIGVFTTPDQNVEVTTTTITAPTSGYYDPNPPYQYISGTPGWYQHNVTVSDSKNQTVALFIMPGMRFQKTDKSAFQFNLAGVSLFRNGDNFNFPIPMCSWFIKF